MQACVCVWTRANTGRRVAAPGSLHWHPHPLCSCGLPLCWERALYPRCSHNSMHLARGRACPRQPGPSLAQGARCAPGAPAPAHSGDAAQCGLVDMSEGGKGTAAQQGQQGEGDLPSAPASSRPGVCGLVLSCSCAVCPPGTAAPQGSPGAPCCVPSTLVIWLGTCRCFWRQEDRASQPARRQEQCSPAALQAEGVEALVRPATALSPGGP